MAIKHLFRVKFTELYEIEGGLGREWIVSAGGGFPKHLIHSYDLKNKTVVFPLEWDIKYDEIPMEKRGNIILGRPVYRFKFGNFCNTVIGYGYVRKMDSVKVEYNPKEFHPNKELGLLTLRIPRRNKARTDKLIGKYQTAKMVVAVRSMESSKVIRATERGERSFPQYLYELAIHRSKWRGFAKELYEQNLVPKTERFAILMSGAIFPRQLAQFKKTD